MKKDIAKRIFILITFSHVEKRGIDRKEVLLRILECFHKENVKIILIAQENHAKEGYHYHAAVLAVVSRYTFIKDLRRKFTEFDGAQLDVQTRKSWATVCEYVLKEDKEPLVWGEEVNLEDIREMIKSRKQHKKNRTKENTKAEIIRKLKEKKDWYDIYEDEELIESCIRNYSGMRAVFEDLQVVKEMKTTVQERICAYLHQHENPAEYDIEELREKYLLLDWIACQLCFGRPIKTRQIFIYGKPSTQKTLIFSFLAKVLRIYFASTRRNDFTGANDYYDLWLFDEFHEPDEGINYGGIESGTPYFNTLLRILDGQECRLDSKYSRVFKKRKNVPIVMIANEMPRSLTKRGPLQERFIRMCFRERILNLREERVIATLWGCMQRRIQSSPLKTQEGIDKVNLAYNHEEGNLYGPINAYKSEQRLYQGNNNEKAIITYPKDIKYCNIHCTYCEENGHPCMNEFFIIKIEGKQKKETYLERGVGRIAELSLIDFLIIPLKKRKNGNQKMGQKSETVERIPVFKDERFSAFIFRRNKKSEIDYAVWPIQITYENNQEIINERKYSKDQNKRVPATIRLIKKEEKLEHRKKIKEESKKIKMIEPKEEINESIKIRLNIGPEGQNGEWQE